MFRLAIVACAAAGLALAEGFTFTIGSPVASQDFRAKTAAFVFRTEGCADPAKAQVSGTAEGLVRGTRQSLSLKLRGLSKPGTYAVDQTWPAEGAWLVNLKGSCDGANAGALVPIGSRGFSRESAQFLPRPATEGEVAVSLKTLAGGGNK